MQITGRAQLDYTKMGVECSLCQKCCLYVYSSDYFPLIPNLFLFLAGASLGVYLRSGRAPKGIYPTRFKSMSFIGRHGLWVYLLHQPVIILVLDIIFKLTGQNTVFL